MNATELAARIDHTVLGPETTLADVERVLGEAREYGMNACVPPCYVAEADEMARSGAADGPEPEDGHTPGVTLAAVVGFPHGQNTPEVKREEAVQAWNDGADELDVVLNVGRLKAGQDDQVREGLSELVASVPVPVKVIVEATLLSEDELERACQVAVDAEAAMVKTSTGFADGGAELDDVEVMSDYLPVKASGGIGSWERARAMFEAGAERIGASSGVAIVEDFRAAEGP